MSNKNCGPDIVKYFVVEPANDVVTGATGNFFVCSGTTFLSTISGCTDSVDFNGNTFYNNSDVFFNGVITACTGIHTSNIYGCSPITVHDELILLNKLTLSAVTQDDTLTQILGRDSSTGEVKYRSVESIITGATSQDTFVTGGTYNEGTTSIDFSGNSVETTFSVSLSGISSNIDIYNTYFVSPTGDDSTAVRGDLHNPFKTITAARNKVVDELSASTVTGDTLIHVYPGSYTEDEIQYENGNFYFEPGATINQPDRGGSLIGVFNLGAANTIQPNTYTADTCNIYGHVDINLGGGSLSVAHFMRGNSESIFEFNKINIGNGFGLVPWNNAKLVAKGIEIDGQTGQYCFRAQDNSEINLNIGKVITTSNTFGLAWKSGFNGVSYVTVDEIIAPSNQIALFTETVGVDTDIVVDYGIIKNEYSGVTPTFLIQNYKQHGGKITYRGNINIKGDNGVVYNNESTGGEINILGDIKSDSTAISLTSTNTTGNTLNYVGNITTTNPNASIDLDDGSIRLDGSLNGMGGTTNGIDVSSGVNLSVGNFSIENVSGDSVTGTGSIEILNNLYIDKPLTVPTTGQYTFTGTTYDGDLNIYNTPTNDNTLTEILGRNSTTGDVEYRDVSSIIGAASADTYVTGFTYDNINTFTISDNSGNTFNTSINVLSATTISATTYFGDGSNLTGISTDDFYVTGGTFSSNTLTLNRQNGSVTITGFTSGMTDSYTTSANLSGDTIVFDNNLLGLNYYNVDLLPLLSGKTNNTDFYSYTASTQTLLDSKVDDSTFISYTANTLNILNTKVDSGINLGGGDEIFSGITGTNMYFRTLSGGSNTTLTTVGDVVKIDVSLASGANYYVTGGTVSGTNLELGRNGGLPNVIIDTSTYFDNTDRFVSGGTYSGGDIFFSGNSSETSFIVDVSDLIDDTNYYVTGSTLNGNTLELSRNGGLSTLSTDFLPILSGFTSTDYYVTGATMSGDTLELSRNGLSNVAVDLSQFINSDTSVTGLTFNSTTYDLTLSQDNGKPSYTSNLSILASDIFVMSGDYNISTGIVTYTYNSGTTFQVSGFTSGMTDSYTTSANLSGDTIVFGNNIQGPNLYNVDLIPLLSGKTNNTDFYSYTASTQVTLDSKTDNTDFWSHTGDTSNPHQTSFSNLTSTGHTHTLSEITDFSSYSGSVQTQIDGKVDNSTFTSYTASTQSVLDSKVDNTTFTSYTANTQNILNTKIDGGINVGGGNEVFSGITGTDIYFRTLSGGTSTTITTVDDVIKIDVDASSDNFYVTGGTYSSGTTSLDFSGNTGFVPFSVNVSELIDDTNTFVTGFTYNDTNTFTISNNNGTNYSASIDIMSGLTVNGNSVFSGTGTDVVQIYGSGSTSPLFRVEGSSGELFSISDSLIGELFAVNNISGLPILVVNSDNTILWGDNTVPSLNTTVKKSINSGLSEIYSIPVSAYTGGFFEYTVTGTGARAGSIMSIFSGTSIDFNETTTNDIGDTSGVTFDMNISGGTANLTVSATTNTWEIRTIVRSI